MAESNYKEVPEKGIIGIEPIGLVSETIGFTVGIKNFFVRALNTLLVLIYFLILLLHQ